MTSPNEPTERIKLICGHFHGKEGLTPGTENSSSSKKIANKKTANGSLFSKSLSSHVLLSQAKPITIGAEELNFRVRHGNGCDLFAIVTRQFYAFLWERYPFKTRYDIQTILLLWLSLRPISISQLHVSPRFHMRPINLIISEGSYLYSEE